MFGKRITLFRLFGFEVRLDLSWVVLAVLITWTLAEGLFRTEYPSLTAGTRWIMGIAGSFGLFASIVFHELAHSLVARRHGIQMRGITLFIFGGVAEMENEPPNPRSEFLMAIVGPAASVFLSVLLLGTDALGRGMGWPIAITAVVAHLGFINLILAIFNLVPAFPLDGGRVLRALLWGWKNDLRWATRVSSAIGMGFGGVLIGLGVLFVILGNFVQGMWWFLIGMFLRGAASAPYKQLIMRQALEGEPVSRFMKTAPVTVPRSIPVQELVEDYVYRHHFKMYPVVENGLLMGCVSIDRIKSVPRDEWDQHSVGEIMDACQETNTIAPDEDAVTALSKMSRTGASRLMVVEDGHLLGLVALRDLLEFLSLKVELEDS